MDTFIVFTIGGLATAAIYAISAAGLVVTFTTSGIFNFAHGAFSMMAAFTFWQVSVDWGVPRIPAAVLVVLVIGPGVGALVERLVMRSVAATSDVVKVVVTVSLMIALIGLANVIWNPEVGRPVPPLVAGTLEVLGVTVSQQRVLTMAMAVAAALVLAVVLRATRLGISMRAVVDDRTLVQLDGAHPGRISMTSWALGAGMAALAGVLLASEQTLSATTMTLVFINSYAVAVVGRLRSLPGVFVGAVVLGLGQSYMTGYIDPSASLGPVSLRSASQALPALMLFVVLVARPSERPRVQEGILRSVVVPAPSLRFTMLSSVAFVAGVAAIGSLLSAPDLNLVLTGFFTALVTLSLVPLTGWAGQISLAQMTFTGIGAIAMANWGANGEPWAVAASVLLCAGVGALVGFPALRLHGIYLALGTASFAMLCSALVFNQAGVMPGGNKQVERLAIGGWAVSSDYAQLIVLAVVFAGIGSVLLALRRSSWGRRLVALRDSPVACATLGMNVAATKVGAFALAAAIAGAAGAVSGRTFLADTLALPSSLSIAMIAVVGGVGMVSGAFMGGLLLGAVPIFARIFATSAIGVFALVSLPVKDLLAVAPGTMGVSLGRDPDGSAPRLAAAYRVAGTSAAALGIAAGGASLIWLLAWLDVIDGWTFVASITVFALVTVTATPLVIGDIDGRRTATAVWIVAVPVVALVVPWVEGIGSAGWRVLAIIALIAVGARGAMTIHGNARSLLPGASDGPPPISPDEQGLHSPLTWEEAVEAGRGIGLHGESRIGVRHDSPTTTTALLELRSVRASYGSIEVLHGIDLTVHAGSVVALLGPNGAGKTTTLRVASGLLRPTSGSLVVGGRDVTGVPARHLARCGVVTVPETRGVYPSLTVRENLLMATHTGTSLADVEDLAYGYFPKLKERRRQTAGTLSGGERQMLAMSRGLAVDPAILLLDELSMGLAPLVVEELYETVREIARAGTSVLVVEQFARTVLSVADVAVIMVNGVIREVGPPNMIEEALSAAYLGGRS